MNTAVDFQQISSAGLESSPYASALAGLRAHEARYWMNKYQHRFCVDEVQPGDPVLALVERILREERAIVLDDQPLQTSQFEVDGLRMSYVLYQSGLVINVMYALQAGGKRAVGFKLAQGMPIPPALESKFKFARQKSALAGEIRGSYFVIKGEY